MRVCVCCCVPLQVVHKLQHHMDPVLSQQHFGDGYTYAPAGAQLAAMSAVPTAAAALQPAALDAARQAMVQQLLATGQLQGQPVDVATLMAAMGGVRPNLLQPQLLQPQLPLTAVPAAGKGQGVAAQPKQTRPYTYRSQPPPTGLEAPEATLARLAPNSLRHHVFEVLLSAGTEVRPSLQPVAGPMGRAGHSSQAHRSLCSSLLLADLQQSIGDLCMCVYVCVCVVQGMNVLDLIDALHARGVGNWQDQRSARASLSATCNQEPSIVRIAPSTFAVAALVCDEKGNVKPEYQQKNTQQPPAPAQQRGAAAPVALTAQQQRQLRALMGSARQSASLDGYGDGGYSMGGAQDGMNDQGGGASDEEPDSPHDELEEPHTQLMGYAAAPVLEPYEYNNTNCSGCRKVRCAPCHSQHACSRAHTRMCSPLQ